MVSGKTRYLSREDSLQHHERDQIHSRPDVRRGTWLGRQIKPQNRQPLRKARDSEAERRLSHSI